VDNKCMCKLKTILLQGEAQLKVGLRVPYTTT
jgi:hypothetical protein